MKRLTLSPQGQYPRRILGYVLLDPKVRMQKICQRLLLLLMLISAIFALEMIFRSSYHAPAVITSTSESSSLHTKAMAGGVGSVTSRQYAVTNQDPPQQNGFLALLESTIDPQEYAFISTTPAEDTYANPTVILLNHWGVGVAYAATAAILAWGGFTMIYGRVAGVGYFDREALEIATASYQHALQLFGRTILAVVVATFSLPLLTISIVIHNDLCTGIMQAAGYSAGGLGFPDIPWASLPSGSSFNFVALLLDIFYIFMKFWLMAQMDFRMIILILLMALFPLATMCWILQQTRSWANILVKLYVFVLATQFIQVVAMVISTSFIRAFSIQQLPITTVVASIASFWLMMQVPVILCDYVGAAALDGGPNASGNASAGAVAGRIPQAVGAVAGVIPVGHGPAGAAGWGTWAGRRLNP